MHVTSSGKGNIVITPFFDNKEPVHTIFHTVKTITKVMLLILSVFLSVSSTVEKVKTTNNVLTKEQVHTIFCVVKRFIKVMLSLLLCLSVYLVKFDQNIQQIEVDYAIG